MEESIYKAVYKLPNNGILTKFSLEITVYGKDKNQIFHRLLDTARDMDINESISMFKLISLERK